MGAGATPGGGRRSRLIASVSRVLIVATDVVGPVMAGPGIRSWEFARGLSGANEVTLAAPPPLPPGEDRLQVIEAARGAVQAAAARADVLVMQPSALALFPGLLEVRAAKVLDLYDPALVEGLELHGKTSTP